MKNIFDPITIDIICRLGVALLLGALIGIERVWAHKTAGIRTYALVSMGSALFVILGQAMVTFYAGADGLNPMIIASQVVVGVGFIGAGLIFTKDSKLMGLTTATGLWVAAGIGMAAGLRLYKVGIIASLLTLFVFVVLWFFEAKLKNTTLYRNQEISDGN